MPRRFGVFRNGPLAALDAGDSKLLKPIEPAALALPVSDCVLDEFERARLAKIGNREDRLEDGLQTGIVPVARGVVDLEEAFIRTLLHLDQVRDRDGSPDL